MSVKSPKITSENQARQTLRPVQPVFEKKELSTYFPKDSIFNKVKTYLSKKKDESGQEKHFEADWRNINISANHIFLFKGVALSKSQLILFDKGAREHYLEERKKELTNAQIAKKAEAEKV